jgi:hypothetical protein
MNHITLTIVIVGTFVVAFAVGFVIGFFEGQKN